MSDTTDTPITDAHMKTLPYRWDFFDYETEKKMRELEHQLAEAREQSSKWQYKATRRFKEICRIKRRVADAREQRDRVAEALRGIRKNYTWKVDPECDCEDCEFCRPIDEALATLDRKEDA